MPYYKVRVNYFVNDDKDILKEEKVIIKALDSINAAEKAEKYYKFDKVVYRYVEPMCSGCKDESLEQRDHMTEYGCLTH